MRITCNRIGGYHLLGLDLRHGANDVDDERWDDIAARLPPEWLAALQIAPEGSEPELVIHDDRAEPSVPVGQEPGSRARERIAEIEACKDLEKVESYGKGETRKTVLAAIDRQIDRLLEGAPR